MTTALNNGSANGTGNKSPTPAPRIDVDKLLAHGWRHFSTEVYPYYVSLHPTPVPTNKSKAAVGPGDRNREDDPTVVPYDNYRFQSDVFRQEMEKRGVTMFCSNMTLELNDAEETNLHTFGTPISLGGLKVRATDNPFEILKNIPSQVWDAAFKALDERKTLNEECTEYLVWRLMLCRPCIRSGHHVLVSPYIEEIMIYGVKFEPKYVSLVKQAMLDGTPSRCERRKQEARDAEALKTLKGRPAAPRAVQPELPVDTTHDSVITTLTTLRRACEEAKQTAADLRALKAEFSKLIDSFKPVRPRATAQDILGPKINTNGDLVPMDQVPTIQETNHPVFVQTGGAR